jgi:hypothetical protein
MEEKMSDVTFACTVVEVTLKDKSKVTYQAGQVLRPKRDPYPFSDMIILGFSNPTKHGDVFVKVGRPYVYVSCIGTTGPTTLSGVETFTLTVSQMVEYDRVRDSTYISGAAVAPVDRPYEDEKLTYTLR